MKAVVWQGSGQIELQEVPDARIEQPGDAVVRLTMGNCPHRAIIPQLVDLVASGVADPAQLLTQIEPIDDVVKTYRTFDTREPGWVKVALAPAA
jgi:threonine dehydrogenase-like Zn-dependent dehydrogenase